MIFLAAVACTTVFSMWRRSSRSPCCLVAIGTLNPCKVGAVRRFFQESSSFLHKHPKLHPVSVSSGVSEQPKSLRETIEGAKNRAAAAFAAISRSTQQHLELIGIGLESGLMEVENEGVFDVCVCAVLRIGADGRQCIDIGLSCAFEIPSAIMKFVNEGKDLSVASNAAGFASDPDIGKHGGLISILTDGSVSREDYTVQAIHMGMIKFIRQAA